MRLKDKVAIVVGAGQSPGEGMGNGRATALRFAQDGANVVVCARREAPLAQLSAEMGAVGLHLVRSYEDLPWQHVLFYGR